MGDVNVQHPIDRLDFPTRARNALVRAGITTPEEVLQLEDEGLLAIRGFGQTSLEQVRERMAVWEQDHVSAGPQLEENLPAEPVPPPPPAFTLLPGRHVVHATWIPGSSGRLFVWGEGQRAGSAEAEHPFSLSPEEIRTDFPSLLPTAAEAQRAVARLPRESETTPVPSPQLIHTALVEEPVVPEDLGRWQIEGVALAPLQAMTFLTDLPQPEELTPRLAPGADLYFWSLAAKLALELLVRQQFAPTLVRHNGGYRALWVPVLDQPEDLRRVEQLAQAMPPLCRAVTEDDAGDPLTPRALLKDFLAVLVDAAVRAWAPPLPMVVARRDSPTLQAWLNALFSEQRQVDAPGETLSSFYDDVARWQEQLLAGVEEAFRICFRLEPPEPPETPNGLPTPVWVPETANWTLRFFLQARDDPSLLVPADMVWRERGSTLRYLDRRFDNPQEKLLTGLGHAARLFPPLKASMRTARPEMCTLSTEQAYAFLREAASLLEQSGFGVLVPQWWKKRHKRLGVRATIMPADTAGGMLNLESLVRFRWQLALGDQSLTPDEFKHLAELKRPLVQVRGEWVELQPEQIEAAIRFWKQRASEETLSLRKALQLSLAQEGEVAELPLVDVESTGWVRELMERLHGVEPLVELPQPEALNAQLRPYQVRGFSWMDFLHRWGLGACLADDMGLGKTIQTISLILRDVTEGQVQGPVLVICPTSVVGNWAREVRRFAPALNVLVHHGSDRASGADFVEQALEAHVVISTYALARRDVETLLKVNWLGLVLDEAQNIKNPAAKQTQAIRSLGANYRLALTGTPVENRLSELWSIMQFLNPGYLGSQQAFRKQFALPIERYQDPEAAERLRNLVQPFILRRVKSDPTIIQDLPEKLENKVYCTLTPEQATLYQAVVEDAMRHVEDSKGIQRKGLVLSMLMRLKQICNHPAHFLGDGSQLVDRSGKLDRLGEMLEEVLAQEERALIFSQFAEMGRLLHQYLRDRFGREVLFLHGGTPAHRRDRMITRFQEERLGPPIFVLSLKAGGLGLNLTRANHVFHFDRWWNPAVEEQATDRAFRIGQSKDVWVHKFIVVGTLEERIDQLIESKKALAESVIGAGEAWLTEMSPENLREIVALSREAIGD